MSKSFLYVWNDLDIDAGFNNHVIAVIASSPDEATELVRNNDETTNYAREMWQNPIKIINLNGFVEPLIVFWL